MSTDIIPRPSVDMTGGEIQNLVELATKLAMSGFFKDATSAEQSFAKLVFGRDLGLGATQALTEIQIIEGKPELSANLQASMVRRYVGPDGERYDFQRKQHTNDVCELVFLIRERGEAWRERGPSSFSMQDATLAGLVRAKSPWEKYPRNMLFARAMSNGVAWFCPEVTGGTRVYSPGEIGGAVDVPDGPEIHDVEVVDAEAVVTPDTARLDLDTATTLAGNVVDNGLGDRLRKYATNALGADPGECDTPEAAVDVLARFTPLQAATLSRAIDAAIKNAVPA